MYPAEYLFIGERSVFDMSGRKPILLTDDSEDSRIAIELFSQKNIDFVEYRIDRFEKGCCGDSSGILNIKAPTAFAPEGVFRGLDRVKHYSCLEKRYYESESAYW